jgi:altronate hydrolase
VLGGLPALGQGCELVPTASVVDGLHVPNDMIVHTPNIQDAGGVRATVRAGVDLIREMLPPLEACRRVKPGSASCCSA